MIMLQFLLPVSWKFYHVELEVIVHKYLELYCKVGLRWRTYMKHTTSRNNINLNNFFLILLTHYFHLAFCIQMIDAGLMRVTNYIFFKLVHK